MITTFGRERAAEGRAADRVATATIRTVRCCRRLTGASPGAPSAGGLSPSMSVHHDIDGSHAQRRCVTPRVAANRRGRAGELADPRLPADTGAAHRRARGVG